MKITPLNNNLQQISVKAAEKKRVEKEELDEILRNSQAVKNAEQEAQKIDGTEKEVVLANIDAANINPELINNVKFFKFHSEKDYQRLSHEVGKNINIYDTEKGK